MLFRSLVGSRSPPLTTSFGISAFDMSRGTHPPTLPMSSRMHHFPNRRLTGSWQKTSYLSSEQQLNLVKLLSPTNLRRDVHDERNAHFCNCDSGLPLRFTEFNDNGDFVRPLPRNRYLRAGNYFPVLVRERQRRHDFLVCDDFLVGSGVPKTFFLAQISSPKDSCHPLAPRSGRPVRCSPWAPTTS